MTLGFPITDSITQAVAHALTELARGGLPPRIETAQVDIKEEPGRRLQGVVQPGQPRNEEAAKYLAGEMACFASTPGGGAIILGISDTGDRIGTSLDEEWLRKRIYELTDRQLTIAVRPLTFESVRLLLLTTHAAIQPVRYKGMYKWRVRDSCTEMDYAAWQADPRRLASIDWSAAPSEHTEADITAQALDIARGYLKRAATLGDQGAEELAAASTSDLLRRIHVLDASGRLTNAGAWLFVATPVIGIDYRRRAVRGDDSTARVEHRGPLVQQIADVEAASEASNRIVHIAGGFAHAQTRAIPLRAFREAIVNGVVHRDWLSRQPTEVEHVGDALTVTSPGGFIGGISAANIISHPAAPRYRSLAHAVAALRLAEHEGIGVDRMVRDMLALGHRPPEITEIDGPYVRVSLIGGDPDQRTQEFLASLNPVDAARDVNTLLLLHMLLRSGWTDAANASPILQRSLTEAESAIERLAKVESEGEPIVVRIKGAPTEAPPAYRLSDVARKQFTSQLAGLNTSTGRRRVIAAWVRARGRVSSTEAADLAGISAPHAGEMLKTLTKEGILQPGRAGTAGRGFFYVPADNKPEG